MSLNKILEDALDRAVNVINPADGISHDHYMDYVVSCLDEAISNGGTCDHIDDVYRFIKNHERFINDRGKDDIYLVYRVLDTLRNRLHR